MQGVGPKDRSLHIGPKVGISTVGTSAPPSSAYQTAVLALSPSLYWRLGDPAGSGTVADTSGNSRTGTPSAGVTLGATGLLSGDADTAATFDGTANDKINVTYSPFAGTATFTGIGLLTDTLATHALWGATGANGPYLRWETTGGGLFRFSPDGSTTVTWTASATAVATVTATFYWAVIVTPSSTAELFINGASLGTRVIGAWGAAPGNFQLALISTNGAKWQGTEDEVAIFGSALTAAQILNLFNKGTGV